MIVGPTCQKRAEAEEEVRARQALHAQGAGDQDVGEEGGAGLADAEVGGDDLPLGLAQIGAPIQEGRGEPAARG